MTQRIDTAAERLASALQGTATLHRGMNRTLKAQEAEEAAALIRAQAQEIARLTAALAKDDRICPEDIHFVMSHPEAVAREMSKLSRRLAEAESERLEQSRLLGMGGDRELALMGKLVRAEKALQRINELAKLVAHDLQGRVEGGKVAAVMQCADVARTALAAMDTPAQGGGDE